MERQYIGARYVPKFADPIEWDNLRSYEAMEIVTYLGTSYTSKKPVPVGVELNNSEYWVVTGNYNAQFEDLKKTVYNNIVYNPTTLDTDIVTNIGLKDGNYNVTENTTIDAQLVVPKGVIINISDGVTLTLNNSLLADRYTIFTGNGNVKFTKQSIIYPEWFGALKDTINDDSIAIQKAINSIESGIISLGSGTYINEGNEIYKEDGVSCYTLKTPITIKNKKVVISGTNLAVLFAYITPILTIGENNSFIENAGIENCMIYYKGVQPTNYNNAMIKLVNCTRCTIKNNRFYGSIYNMYIAKSVLLTIKNNEFFSIVNSGVYEHGYGITIEGNTDSANASLTIEKNVFNFYNSVNNISERIGIYYTGNDLRDIFIDSNDFTYCWGIVFKGVGNTQLGMNIHLLNNIIDASNGGIYLYNIANSSIEISGGWISVTGVANCIHVEKCNSVTISNVECECDLGTAENTGIVINNCGGANIQGCLFQNAYYAIRNIGTPTSFIGNTISAYKNQFTVLSALKFAIYNMTNTLNVLGNNIISDGSINYENALACDADSIYTGLNNFGALTNITNTGVIHNITTN